MKTIRHSFINFMVVLSLCVSSLSIAACGGDEPSEQPSTPIVKDENDDNKNNGNETMTTTEIYVTTPTRKLTVRLADNSSARALADKLRQGDVVVAMSDYGNFEKVGALGFSLPTNDERITTTPGDVILYQGNNITIYYDTNTWTFTRLGHIDGATRASLLEALGQGDVTVRLSLK